MKPRINYSKVSGVYDAMDHLDQYLDGSGLDIPGGSPQHVTNGTHSIEADLTATKSPGIFPAGNYQGTVTVRCE